MTSPYTINPGGLLRCCVQVIQDLEEVNDWLATQRSRRTVDTTTCPYCGAKLERDEQRVWRWVREG